MNPAMCRISGYSRDELIGQNPRLFRSGRHDEGFYHRMWQEIKGPGSWRGEIWNRRKNGEIFPGLLTISTVEDGSGKRYGFVASTSDLSPLHQAQERTEYLARHDALTSLPNRDALQDLLQEAMAQADQSGEQVVVSYLDLDQFKLVNESLGYQAGDRTLQEVARRLRRAWSRTTAWCAGAATTSLRFRSPSGAARMPKTRRGACWRA